MNWTEILSAAAILFLVMDPLGNVPVFNAVLSRMDPDRRVKVIARELLIALLILLGILFAGNATLAFLGLTKPSLNIAGGILLFIISLRMIFPGRSDPVSESEKEDPFIVPLAVPLVAGPSTIAVLLLLSSGHPDRIIEWALTLFMAWLATTVILAGSPKLLSVIGTRGSSVETRIQIPTCFGSAILTSCRQFDRTIR
ncbi:hypothetical protein JXA40_08225 [bacterium]|nr:hypothetical protein [candidate division CSSED10-310 bacterium]